jgi:hypothetical protein
MVSGLTLFNCPLVLRVWSYISCVRYRDDLREGIIPVLTQAFRFLLKCH